MSKNKLPLKAIEPDKLTIYANASDLRRDLHVYVNYVNGRNIKRSYRGNELPQADYKRLAQLMKIDEAEAEFELVGSTRWFGGESPSWVDYVDHLALKMGFVSYNTQGEYRGYSSSEPSFKDNYIGFNPEAYRKFLTLPLADQEHQLFDALVDDYNYSRNEFVQRSILGRLDRFPGWGIGTGILPSLNFARIRRFLLDLLQGCEPGTWYSTASLITYLRANHRFFLIPEKLPPADKYARTSPKRYGNFYEHGDFSRESVPDDAPDSFERVEGRYLERFLEGIPLTLGYVDVAYDPAKSSDKGLSRGKLKAFRINERFLQAMNGNIPQPRVTIQPNFEIYIESAFYPAYLINRLTPLTDLIREDTTTILKLQKQKIATQLAENDGLDVVALLKNLTGKELPQNVLVELQEWASHADVFTLYDGFGLVEFADKLPTADSFMKEAIDESVWLVRDPADLFVQLRDQGATAILVHHPDQKLARLPERFTTVFPRQTAVTPTRVKKAKHPVTVKREPLIALYFPDDDLFEKFRKALLDLHCLVEANKEKRTLTIPGTQEAQLKQAIKLLSDNYAIRLEDLA